MPASPRLARLSANLATSLAALGLGAPVALAAPPAAPPDARGAFALYCASSCGEPVVEGASPGSRLPRQARRFRTTTGRWSAGAFGTPGAEELSWLGRGEVAGLDEAQELVILSWAGPVAGAPARTLAVGEALLAAAGTEAAWIEDLDTGLVYDTATFDRALDGLRRSPLDTSSLSVVRSEEDRGALVLRTAGLRRLGLPDLVVGGVSEAQEAEVGVALNATAQAVAEDGLRERVPVDRLQVLPSAIAGCAVEGSAHLRYARGRLSDGSGALAELTWRGSVDCGPAEAPLVEAPAAEAPAAEAPAVEAPAAEAPAAEAAPRTLEEAQAAAHRQLRGPVRAAFRGEGAELESLYVKAPFTTPEERVEWLWVEVESWEDPALMAGRLASAPRLEVGVGQGEAVEVPVDYVFDYLLRYRDGREEGNGTAAFVQ